MYPRNKKTRLLLSLMFAGWCPYAPKINPAKEILALMVQNKLVTLGVNELVCEEVKKGRFHLLFSVPYRLLTFNPRNKFELVGIPPLNFSFNLWRPQDGLYSPKAKKPDLGYLRQFQGAMLKLTELLGRAPSQYEIIMHIWHGTQRAISQKAILAALKEGEGVLWQSEIPRRWGRRRLYYPIISS